MLKMPAHQVSVHFSDSSLFARFLNEARHAHTYTLSRFGAPGLDCRMRRLLRGVTFFIFIGSTLDALTGSVWAQQPRAETQPEAQVDSALPSLWFESGVAYRRPEGETELTPRLRFGVRGVQPLNDTTALYAAFAVDGQLLLDLGGWYSFLPGADDVFGFRSYAGTGLTYAAGKFGVALSAAVSYELSTETSLLLVYTHRPLLLPELGQAFDVSVGVRVTPP